MLFGNSFLSPYLTYRWPITPINGGCFICYMAVILRHETDIYDIITTYSPATHGTAYRLVASRHRVGGDNSLAQERQQHEPADICNHNDHGTD